MNNNLIEELFNKHHSEYLKFERVINKTNSRPDLHAFNLLDKLKTDTLDIVGSAEHDIIYLNVYEDVIQQLTEKQIIDLIRCGVLYNKTYQCLYLNI